MLNNPLHTLWKQSVVVFVSLLLPYFPPPINPIITVECGSRPQCWIGVTSFFLLSSIWRPQSSFSRSSLRVPHIHPIIEFNARHASFCLSALPKKTLEIYSNEWRLLKVKSFPVSVCGTILAFCATRDSVLVNEKITRTIRPGNNLFHPFLLRRLNAWRTYQRVMILWSSIP